MTSYTYSGNGFTATLNVASESMTAGKFYQFIYRAVNAIGNSDFSGVVTYGVADIPATPSAPTKVESSSTRTSITVTWSAVAST